MKKELMLDIPLSTWKSLGELDFINSLSKGSYEINVDKERASVYKWVKDNRNWFIKLLDYL